MTETAGDAAPDPLGVGVEVVLEIELVRVLGGRVLVEELVVVVMVSEMVDGMSIEDESNEEGGTSGETVSVGEVHVGVPEESRLHSYPPAGGKRS